jgi:uncharacterized repeat protein (TIGR03803 family)
MQGRSSMSLVRHRRAATHGSIAAVLFLMAASATKSLAATLTVLYAFNGTDGAEPLGGVAIDRAGAVYGTTSTGGITGGSCGSAGCGTVFKLTPPPPGQTTWTRQSFEFHGTDGANPSGGLFVDANGVIYGTTYSGGSANLGTVFKLTPLDAGQTAYGLASYSFSGGDGANPEGSVFVDATGAIFGTTSAGGAAGQGTAFKLSPPGPGQSAYTPQSYSFSGGTDGAAPLAGIFVDAAGGLYGTTSSGGNGGLGTVFKFTPLSTPLQGYTIAAYNFVSANDGETPFGGVVTDSADVVYGTTFSGGVQALGTVFRLTPGQNGSGYSKATFSFGGTSGSPTAGAQPSGGIVLDATGAIYGTAQQGGTGSCIQVANVNFGCGAIFKLTPPGAGGGGYSEAVLYSFTGGTDGSTPEGNLAVDGNGALYGAASSGGSGGSGVVFKLTP